MLSSVTITTEVTVRDARQIKEEHDRKPTTHQADQIEFTIASASKG
jgi:hypothetical protein